MALINKLQAIANAIRSKTGKTDLLTLEQMPTEIEGIQTGGGDLIDEELTFSGDCKYAFAYEVWNWFLEKFKDRIKFNNISDASYMFFYSQIEDLSRYTINLQENNRNFCSYMFESCEKLKYLPNIVGQIYAAEGMFYRCYYLREISDAWAENIQNGIQSAAALFDSCYALRYISPLFFSKLKATLTSIWSALYYRGAFQACIALDELVGLPLNENATITSNFFSNNTFSRISRVKRIVFETKTDGPYIIKMKSQTINLSNYVGYVASNNEQDIIKKASLTTATKVTDDASYQALKDNPDWWTTDITYSRYNHDSAVETINSLPDTSEYLATAGGTNTIKFEGRAGSATDGGAINTLTEEEIAVAAAKGWTVTLV